MSRGRVTGAGGIGRAVAAVAALVTMVGLAGTGRALAGPGRGGSGGSRAVHPAVAGVISTLVGGVGGPARATRVGLFVPCGVSSGAGRLYVADAGSVRSVNAQTDWLTTPAGTGSIGPLGDGGPATTASVGIPPILGNCGMALDQAGNLVVAEPGNERVRVVAHRTGTFYGKPMTAGDIYTVAGNGGLGFSGDGGPATSAQLDYPAGLAVDGAGNLILGDRDNNRIRVVAVSTGTFYGQPMTAGDIYTVAGDGTGGYSGDGIPATGAELRDPTGVAIDAADNLVIADSYNTRVRVVAVRTGTFYGKPMTAGDIYTVAGDGAFGFSGDGGPATSAELSVPEGVTEDGTGNLVIADRYDGLVRVVAARTGTFYGQPMTAGDIYRIAGERGGHASSGDGGPATRSRLLAPTAVLLDAAGNLVIADPGADRVRVVAVTTGTFYGQPMTAGDIYTVAGHRRSCASPITAATRTQLCGPQGIAADRFGDVAIADTGNVRIKFAVARTGTFFGQRMTAGHVYVVAGAGFGGYSGDGGPGTSAELNAPEDATIDGHGNVVIADSDNQRIRVVAARSGTFYGVSMTAGDIYTVAGGQYGYSGDGGSAISAGFWRTDAVATDGAGNLFISDSLGDRVRMVAASTGTFFGISMTAGDIYTVAGNGTESRAGGGGPATAAGVRPAGLAVDSAGNLVIADRYHELIRVVAASTGTFYGRAMTLGHIYGIAGDGTVGFAGDGGRATHAELDLPNAVAVDGAGNVLIADTGNQRIRVIAASTGTFYGVSMTAGDIYTVAGNGTAGFAGDGGPPARAELNSPVGVTVSGPGGLVIADTGNSRLRAAAG